MDDAAIDPALVRRVDHAPRRVRPAPGDVDAALREASKPFTLWHVQREIFEIGPVKKEPVSIPKPESPKKLELPRRIEATRELVSFAGATEIAKRAYRGFRALMKVALTRPYRRSE